MASSPFKAVLQRTGSSNDDCNAEVTVGSEDSEKPRPKKLFVEAVDAVRIYWQKMGTFEQESKDVLDNLERLTEQFERERLRQEIQLTNLQQQLASERGLRAAEMKIAKESFKLLKTIFEKDDLNQNNSFNKKQGKQSEKFVGTSARPRPHQVGLVYDERMTQHRNVKKPEHPEKPARITTVYQKLKETGLLDRCLKLDARMATREELLWLHTADYIDELSLTAGKKQSFLDSLEKKYDSVFLCPETYQAALLSAGSSMQVVESILSNECRSGFAVIRPPGHLAESDKASGFCFFNNVALAAKYAIEMHQLERILIVDWSVCHGSGIQTMFKDDPRVLCISLHRQDISRLNPKKSDGNVVGKGPGTGRPVNIAWPSDGMGDPEYLAAFWQIIMPIAYQFNPQLVLVAAGFDAALGDPLGGCKVSPEGYGHMCHMLTSLAEGRVAVLLEGGFNLTSTAESMLACVKALLGDSLRMPKVEGLKPDANAVLQFAASYLLPYNSRTTVRTVGTEVKPLFEGSAFGPLFVNAPTSSAPTANQGFDARLFGNMELGGTPTSANAKRNVFGGSAWWDLGGGIQSGQGMFGATSAPSSFGVPALRSAVFHPPTAAPPSSFGSTSPPSFGGFGQTQTTFARAATFKVSPLFGSKPTLGGGATFGSPVNSNVAPKPEAGIGDFSANNVPIFGELANSGPSFETLASSGNAQPAFRGAAFSFSSRNPPSYGGGSSFSSWR